MSHNFTDQKSPPYDQAMAWFRQITKHYLNHQDQVLWCIIALPGGNELIKAANLYQLTGVRFMIDSANPL